MKYIFGPVNSRRLGLSLGIDLVQHKTCSLDCIYCECGATTNLTADIKEYVPTIDVISELDSFLADRPLLDVLTFSGAGEPTLHSGIYKIIDFLKNNYSEYPVAVITNSTILHLPQVRKSILKADIIMPSLDAVSNDVFNKITCPHNEIKADKIIQGITSLRKEYSGKLILEIFIIPDINDTQNELELLKQAATKINPDIIQLNTLHRPGTIKNLKPATTEKLNEISEYFLPLKTEILQSSGYSDRTSEISAKDISGRILSLLKRRPSGIDDISAALGVKKSELINITDKFINDGIIEEIKTVKGNFLRFKRI